MLGDRDDFLVPKPPQLALLSLGLQPLQARLRPTRFNLAGIPRALLGGELHLVLVEIGYLRDKQKLELRKEFLVLNGITLRT